MKYISIICFILLLASCGSNDEFYNMSKLSFGMKQSEVELKLKTENISFVPNNGLISTNELDYLGVRWSYLRADFTEDHLSDVTYRINGSDTVSTQTFNKVKLALQNHYSSIPVKEDEHNKFTLSNNEETISLNIENTGFHNSLVLSYREIPSQEELNRRNNIAQERERDIDEKLQKLNEAMIEYVKCLDSDPYNLRAHYVSQVTSLNDYLKSRVEYMTPKQKEWYNKLQNVTL